MASFYAFYGQRSITAVWTSPSPWSIIPLITSVHHLYSSHITLAHQPEWSDRPHFPVTTVVYPTRPDPSGGPLHLHFTETG